MLHDILFVLDGKELSDTELELSRFPKIDKTVARTLEVLDQNEDFFANYRAEIIKSYSDEVLAQIN